MPSAPTIDVRSDTVTHPTATMREAMGAAPVGDDVFGDDPTVTALEARAAALLGMEAALFVTSGTMGNLVSIMAHVPRGGEIIAPSESHIFNDEAANYAVAAGAGLRPIRETPTGEMPIDEVIESIQDASDPHCPITSLVVIENCHAHTMSRPIGPDYVAQLRAQLPDGLPIHIDGARLFNAVVALDVPAADLVRDADSVTFCLSKGLSAPVGSVVAGPRDFIDRARRARKLLGGGLRQVGVLAAAGLVALSDGPDGTVVRLSDDHRRARRLAEGLSTQTGIVSPGRLAQPSGDLLDPERAVTNFVLFAVQGGAPRRSAYLSALRERGVGMVSYPHGQIRAVTHRGISDDDIDAILAASEEALEVTRSLS
jgi:threonine aldolase